MIEDVDRGESRTLTIHNFKTQLLLYIIPTPEITIFVMKCVKEIYLFIGSYNRNGLQLKQQQQ